MPIQLHAFLDRHPVSVEGTVVWRPSGLRLRVGCHLAAELPPLALVTSVRGLVFQDDAVLLVRDAAGAYVLPGGRREDGESLEETLVREVLEETGLEVRGIAPLGFIYFRHVDPEPPGYRYPYPDFFQVIYRATAAAWRPESRHPQDHDLDAALVPIEAARALDLPADLKLYLCAAVEDVPGAAIADGGCDAS